MKTACISVIGAATIALRLPFKGVKFVEREVVAVDLSSGSSSFSLLKVIAGLATSVRSSESRSQSDLIWILSTVLLATTLESQRSHFLLKNRVTSRG